jgi:hypothetical protein
VKRKISLADHLGLDERKVASNVVENIPRAVLRIFTQQRFRACVATQSQRRNHRGQHKRRQPAIRIVESQRPAPFAAHGDLLGTDGDCNLAPIAKKAKNASQRSPGSGSPARRAKQAGVRTTAGLRAGFDSTKNQPEA